MRKVSFHEGKACCRPWRSTRADEDQRVHIVGTTGRIEIDIPFNIPTDRETRIFVTSGGYGNTETVTCPTVDQYTIQAELFASAVLTDTDYPVGIDDAIANMAVIDTILG